jgi:hypothetical protein
MAAGRTSKLQFVHQVREALAESAGAQHQFSKMAGGRWRECKKQAQKPGASAVRISQDCGDI